MSTRPTDTYIQGSWLSGISIADQIFDDIKDYPEGNCTFELDNEVLEKILLQDPEVDRQNLDLVMGAMKQYMNVPEMVYVPEADKPKNNYKKIKQINKKKIKKKLKKKMRKKR